MHFGCSVRLDLKDLTLAQQTELRRALTMTPVDRSERQSVSQQQKASYPLFVRHSLNQTIPDQNPRQVVFLPRSFVIQAFTQDMLSLKPDTSSQAAGITSSTQQAQQPPASQANQANQVAQVQADTSDQGDQGKLNVCAVDTAIAKAAQRAERAKTQNLSVFEGKLRDYQQKAVQHVVSQLRSLRCKAGLLEAGCGIGKTTMALFVAHVLGLRTAVIVHTGELLNQWPVRIRSFLPNAKIGVLQGKRRPEADVDICVCTVQTCALLEHESMQQFGFLIIDECHHICCRTFSKALAAFDAMFMLGLSATLHRPDQLGFAIEWLVGPVLYTIKRHTPNVQVLMCGYYNESFKHATRKRFGILEMDYPTTMTRLAQDKSRTRRIAELVHLLVGSEQRSCVVLASRVSMLEDLALLLPSAGLLTGSQKDAERAEAKTKHIILASMQIAAEGLDVPHLDTVVIITDITCVQNDEKANGRIEQIVGRVVREMEGKAPLVVDFYDAYEMFERKANARLWWYQTKNFKFRPRRFCGPLQDDASNNASKAPKVSKVSKPSKPSKPQVQKHSLKPKPSSAAPCMSTMENMLGPFSTNDFEQVSTPMPSLEDAGVIQTLQKYFHESPVTLRADQPEDPRRLFIDSSKANTSLSRWLKNSTIQNASSTVETSDAEALLMVQELLASCK